MIFISTPFSRAAADRLNQMNVPAYKIGSGECNNYPLLKHIASFGKPIILSTGMNTIKSIKKAVAIFDEVSCGWRIAIGGAQEYLGITPDMTVVAKCISNGYPMD